MLSLFGSPRTRPGGAWGNEFTAEGTEGSCLAATDQFGEPSSRPGIMTRGTLEVVVIDLLEELPEAMPGSENKREAFMRALHHDGASLLHATWVAERWHIAAALVHEHQPRRRQRCSPPDVRNGRATEAVLVFIHGLGATPRWPSTGRASPRCPPRRAEGTLACWCAPWTRTQRWRISLLFCSHGRATPLPSGSRWRPSSCTADGDAAGQGDGRVRRAEGAAAAPSPRGAPAGHQPTTWDHGGGCVVREHAHRDYCLSLVTPFPS